MKDSRGSEYVEIAEYPGDPYWQIGTLHAVKRQERVDGSLIDHAGEIGEVVRHGRAPKSHDEFAKLVVLSETSGIPLNSDDYEILVDSEGPVLRFSDGSEEWYCGQSTSVLFAVTGHDPSTYYREKHGTTD